MPIPTDRNPCWCGALKSGTASQCLSCHLAGLADVDDLTVDLLVSGIRPLGRVTPAERRAAIAILSGRGLGPQEISRRIGFTERTVQRHRAALRQLDPTG